MNVLDIVAKNSPHMSWIKDNTMLLILHGSRGYNTHNENSDYDYKGVAIPTSEYLFGFSKKFEQVELKKPHPDTVIYDIRKFFNLASRCNHNIIEVLHTDSSNIIQVNKLGEKLISYRDDFLSKKVRWSFSGYSISQLKKIQLHRRYLLNPPSKYPTRSDLGLPEQTLIPKDQLAAAEAEIRKEMEKFSFNFMENLDEDLKIDIRYTMSQMLAQLKITADDHWAAAARTIGLSDNFIELMQKERSYSNLKREWDNYQEWRKNRNPARAADEEKYKYDPKYAYHLVRLMKMCREILSTGKVIVKRPDFEELLFIRHGGWTYEQLIEFAEKEDKAMDELYKSSILPHSPNINKLDKLCMELIEEQNK